VSLKQRREKQALEAQKLAHGLAKNLRAERRHTMRYYQRQRLWRALQRARLELAMRKAGPPVFLLTLGAAALTLAIALVVKALRG